MTEHAKYYVYMTRCQMCGEELFSYEPFEVPLCNFCRGGLKK